MPTLDWIGKNKVINHHQKVPYRVLNRQYSYNVAGQSSKDNGSGNMIIHGDNLEALKALLPKYEGKVKCIYIDPPYNTGNEGWVYNDNVNDPKIKKWLGEVVGKEGEDLSRHDKWLCMMYPRIRLLQKLLADDGAIFISIDDNENAVLKLLCDEIFGQNNFIASVPRVTKKSGKAHSDTIAKNHDYILIYTKKPNVSFYGINGNEEGFDHEDEYFEKRGKYKLNQTLDYNSLWYNPTMDFPIQVEDEVFYAGGTKKSYLNRHAGHHDAKDWVWRWSQAKFDFGYSNGFIVIKSGRGRKRIYTKTYLNASIEKDANGYFVKYTERETKMSSLEFIENKYSNDNSKKEIAQYLNANAFDFPKPTSLIEKMLALCSDKDSIILDSFAGSGTTAHAVLNMNKADGGNRKFILVELMDYADSITAERVKRVIKGYGEGEKAVEGTGGDFSYYELGDPLLIGENINEKVGIDKIREYIWYMETRQPFNSPEADNPYYLGSYNHTDYYFNYEPDRICVLDHEFMKTITKKAESYMIYADRCSLSNEELAKFSITFKKIPRDITRL